MAEREVCVRLSDSRTVKKEICVLDTDAGIDDMTAVCVTPLLGNCRPDYVVVCPGNTDIDHAVRNVALIRKQLGLEFVIVRGEAAAQTATEKDSFHGFDGMGNFSDRVAERLSFCEADIADVIPLSEFETILRGCDKITYTTIGPLSVLVHLLRDPEIRRKISEIYTMGGGFREYNCSHGTEFNFAKSPEAVRELLAAGKNITLFPLDITNHHVLTAEDVEEYRGNAFFPEFYEILRFNLEANDRFNHIPAAVLHDMVPLLYRIRPEAFVKKEMRVLADEYGRTFEDPAGQPVSVVLSGMNGKELLREALSPKTADLSENG